MSIIDVRDLAALHVAALEQQTAQGRYFAVRQSWHWREIVSALADAAPGFAPPAFDPDVTPAKATQFDLSRRDSLGVSLRDLPEIMESVVQELRRREMI